MTGTYDAELNTIYWGIGNPAPNLYAAVRPGDNLYSDSVVALNADTGELRWYFQFTPHDTYDYDATETPMLVDLLVAGQTEEAFASGKPKRVLLCAGSDIRRILGSDSVREGDLGERN